MPPAFIAPFVSVLSPRLRAPASRALSTQRRAYAPPRATAASSSNTPAAASAAKSPAESATTADAFRLAPSDFAFLWQECRRCFYLKVHGRLYRPRAPFPSVFGSIDLAMKRHFRGLRTTDVLPDMPPGVFLCEDDDAWVESLPLAPSAASPNTPVFVRGMLDALVRLDDGGLAVIDFKTSDVSPRSAATYSRQLHAYAMALQRPSQRSELAQADVPHLGLVVYSPDAFTTPVRPDADGSDAAMKDAVAAAALTGQLKYVPIKRDDEAFTAYLAEVADVLAAPEPPPPPPPAPRSRRGLVSSCPYCQFLTDAAKCNC